MRNIKIIISFITFLFSFGVAFAAIDMTVSPIKYELEGDPGTSVTKTATLYNHDNIAIPITTTKSDFTSNGTTGGPSFVRYSELVHSDQQMSSWITLSSSGFTIAANGKHTIDFTIDIPVNATPGGHYAAVFFQNNNSENTGESGGTRLGINVDYAIIILLTVSGEVNTQIEIIDPIVNNGGYNSASKKDHNLNGGKKLGHRNSVDDCLLDFTNSNFDGKCYDNPVDLLTDKGFNKDKEENSEYSDDVGLKIKLELDNSGNNNSESTGEKDTNNSNDTNSEDNNNKKDDFEVSFTLPIKNTGNTHIKPKGTIKLIDEDGNVIKGVGKKNIYNKLGAVIGVEVVDYLPINDNGGNVLPKSQRNFGEKWEGFPYQTLTEDGKIVMKNMSPDTYYSKQNIGVDRILMPWERVCFRKNDKKIKALINIIYKDDNGEDIEYSSAQEIPVVFTEKYIGINPYIVIPFVLVFGLFFLLWFIALGKRRKCVNKDCKKKIKRRLIRCPHCDTKQKESVSSKKKTSKKSKKK